jgi:hypothetical protein
MPQIFIAHTHADAPCAAQIRNDLEAQGYLVWRATPGVNPEAVSYPRMLETGLRGSAALVVVWSAQAARDEWIERQILFAQRLKKPILPLVIDRTDLPITLINVQSIAGPPPCAGLSAQLLPHLPPPDSDDLLLALLEQLAHDHIRERKAGIERARDLLDRAEYREEVLALLEDVARTDMMIGVREAAQAVLDAVTQKGAPPATGPAGSRHIFGVRCPNGHITYFDKRRVCPASGDFVRNVVRRAGVDLDKIHLKCGQAGCDQEMVVPVDCEGYK